MNGAEFVLVLLLGIGLAAATGFRVFVPLFVAGLAVQADYLAVASGFEWLGQEPVVLSLGVASALEIGAYYVAWLDNALDALELPASIVAGTLISASVFTDMHPFMQWTLALIAGGGIAGTIQASTAVGRLGSSVLTGGLGNSGLATLELVGSASLAGLTLAYPVLIGGLVLVGILSGLGWFGYRSWTGEESKPEPGTVPGRPGD